MKRLESPYYSDRQALGSLAIVLQTILELTGRLKASGGITIKMSPSSSSTSSMDGSPSQSSFEFSIDIPSSSKGKEASSSSRRSTSSSRPTGTLNNGIPTKTIPPFVVASKMSSTLTCTEILTPELVDLSSPSPESSPPPLKRARGMWASESFELNLLDPLPPLTGPPLHRMLPLPETLEPIPISSPETPISPLFDLSPMSLPMRPTPHPLAPPSMMQKNEKQDLPLCPDSSMMMMDSQEDYCEECFCFMEDCVCDEQFPLDDEDDCEF